VNTIPRLADIYHGDFSYYEHKHIQENLDLFIICKWRIEYMRDTLDS